MAVREGGSYYRAAMDSLLGQSFPDFEFIVVDDGSSDGTTALLEAYRQRDPRLRVLRNDTSRGLPVSLNRGLALCRAPLVARADADDIHHPDRLAKQLAHLHAHPRIGVLSCGFHRIDPGDQRIDTRVPVTGDARIRFRMLFTNSLLNPGAMFRTALVRAVGGYDLRYWTAEDTDLWARLMPVTRFDNLPEPLVSYRIHPSSAVRTRGEVGDALSLSVPARLQAHYLGYPPGDREVRAAVDLFQDLRFLEREDIRIGHQHLRAILAQAGSREPTAVLGDFHARVAASLRRQARLRARRDPGRALYVLGKTIQWWLVRPGAGTRLAPATSS